MFRRLVSLVCFPVIWVVRIGDHRAAMSTLGQLEDRELADIGLSRQDLRDATALPFGADPTLLLAARAQERVQGRRARRRGVRPPPAMAAE